MNTQAQSHFQLLQLLQLFQLRRPRRPQAHLRLALPPAADLCADSLCAFALIDRHGAVARAGELPLARIAADVPAAPLHAILAPCDAVAAQVTLPPVPRAQMDAAASFAVEPMVLSDMDSLCIAHGPRAADGTVAVAWADRQAIARVWAQLHDAGLNVAAMVPHPAPEDASTATPLPDQDAHAALWRAPLAPLSLAHRALKPGGHTRPWQSAAAWLGACILVWLGGFYAWAMGQAREVRAVQDAMARMTREVFPQIPVVIAPLKQARDARDALRLTHGMTAGDDFIPMALAAARALGFATGHVHAIFYENGQLTLTLTPGYTPPAHESVLALTAAAQSLRVEKDVHTAHTWRVRRAGTGGGVVPGAPAARALSGGGKP